MSMNFAHSVSIWATMDRKSPKFFCFKSNVQLANMGKGKHIISKGLAAHFRDRLHAAAPIGLRFVAVSFGEIVDARLTEEAKASHRTTEPRAKAPRMKNVAL